MPFQTSPCKTYMIICLILETVTTSIYLIAQFSTLVGSFCKVCIFEEPTYYLSFNMARDAGKSAMYSHMRACS